ncbi:hypothetical protein HAX54_049529 [Datura stramonium]|uniref:Uncharacterized protein n=1 Tax=Datura stramonium TaxID=4076 RepID=A0ABS8SVU1_DATST|nr:hypothetical protein [Datura stramonium]
MLVCVWHSHGLAGNMTLSKQSDKGKASTSSKSKVKDKATEPQNPTNSCDDNIFYVSNMKEYYLKFQGRSLTPKKRFDLVRLGDDFPNINKQFDESHWHTFTDALPGFFHNLVMEFYTSYQERQDSMKHKREVMSFLVFHR